ncbi:acyl carrier protein [Pseudoflavonifractor sp. 524-17]|uniref:acyl carrier protein n=1 Tax=Pseudoflavonifractor sp. 524-17 TaxID=2304577 RepID=UPI00137A0AFE|nr:acyl carrier protein [Pseudoflavonifractor sp. 524-17]NCE63345.1 acyl carrier protein [Pseudoflavonifractor sp. 524-17]
MIFEKIAALLAEQLGVEADSITMDTSFEELGADSVDVVDLTMAVEETFHLEDLADENLSGITTVGDFVRFLQSKLD